MQKERDCTVAQRICRNKNQGFKNDKLSILWKHTLVSSLSLCLSPSLFSLSTLSFLITAYLCLASFCTLHPTGREEFCQKPKFSLFLFNVSSKNKIAKSVSWLPVALAITGKDSEWVCLQHACLSEPVDVLALLVWMWAHFVLLLVHVQCAVSLWESV